MDLANELRRIADIEKTGYSEKVNRLAADEIERLRARITELERDLRAEQISRGIEATHNH